MSSWGQGSGQSDYHPLRVSGCNFLCWCDGQTEDIGPRVPHLGWETTVPGAVLKEFGLSHPKAAHGSLVSTSSLGHPPDTTVSPHSMLWVP